MQYFIFTPTVSSCIWWPFCIEVLSQHYARRMLMRTGNRLTVRWSLLWLGRREAKIRPSKGCKGQGGSLHHCQEAGPVGWCGGRLSVLTFHWSQRPICRHWQSMMAHWFQLCGEANACICFSSRPLQYIVIPAVPIWIHPPFFPLFENKLNKAELQV